MAVYKYQGVGYNSVQEIREAVFKAERKAFPKCETAEEWAVYGVEFDDTVAPLTREQLEKKVRDERNTRLRKTDYYVMPDYPSTEEGLTEVKAYRKALRDITEQVDFPVDVVWPNVPAVIE